jgi:hypothetical protein
MRVDSMFDFSKVTIRHGNHRAPKDPLNPENIEGCVMEWVYLRDCLERGVPVNEIIAGWTDRPPCSSPVVSSLLIRFNDRVRASDNERRTRVLLPLIDVVRGSGSGSQALEERRRWAACDWSLRVATPRLLRTAGLVEQAATLECLPEIRGCSDLVAARGATTAAWNAASGLRRANWTKLRDIVRTRMLENLPPAADKKSIEEVAAVAVAVVAVAVAVAAEAEAAVAVAVAVAAVAVAAVAVAAVAAVAEAVAVAEASPEDLQRIASASADAYQKNRSYSEAYWAARKVAGEVFAVRPPKMRPAFLALRDELDGEFVELIKQLCAMRQA